MEVKSSALRLGVCFLNSEEDFRDAKNFTVFLDKDALQKFKEAKIDDPAAHFKGKTVQVKGKVKLYRDRPEIAVSGPGESKSWTRSSPRGLSRRSGAPCGLRWDGMPKCRPLEQGCSVAADCRNSDLSDFFLPHMGYMQWVACFVGSYALTGRG
jgi:hypothetical protein